jgi:hypothetical protein
MIDGRIHLTVKERVRATNDGQPYDPYGPGGVLSDLELVDADGGAFAI